MTNDQNNYSSDTLSSIIASNNILCIVKPEEKYSLHLNNSTGKTAILPYHF